MRNLGYYIPNSIVRSYFSTFARNGSAVTFTGSISNIRIYKDGNVIQRSSTAGCVLSKDFDGIIGTHLLTIDLSDNTDAGFYALGSDYAIMLQGVTIDTKTVDVILCQFNINYTSDTTQQFTFTITTTTSNQSVTLNQLATNVDSTITWGDGNTTGITAGSTAAINHTYVTAGIYDVSLPNCKTITQIDFRANTIGSLKTEQLKNSPITFFVCTLITGSTISSADMTTWRPTNWDMYDLPVGGTYNISTSDMNAWNPSVWTMYSMPTGGTYNIFSADMTTWNLITWYLFSMPTGGTYNISSANMTAWRPTNWALYDMPSDGTYNISSANMTAWRPTSWYLFSMTTGTYNISTVDMSSWNLTNWYLANMLTGTYNISSANMTTWNPTSWALFSMPTGTYNISSANMTTWRPTSWYLYFMPTGTYNISSANMTAWRPTSWYLFSMTTGTYNISSANMTAWNPSVFSLAVMPTGTYSISGTDFSGWTSIQNLSLQDNGFSQATVNSILSGLWTNKATYTYSTPVIDVSGSNSAPSGIYQAASPPTTGKEYAYDLHFGSYRPAGPEWTVTFTA